MAFRITYLRIISVLLHVTLYKTMAEAGAVYMEGNYSHTDNPPDSCFSFEIASTRCELIGFDPNDSENATQFEIEFILSWAEVNIKFMERLEIEYTIIRNIPVTICRLKQLGILSLNHNRLSALRPPDCFAEINQLEEFDFEDNQISDLPNEIFKDLRKLWQLSLSINNISVLPKGIFDNLQQLNSLDLSFNQISVLPEGIFKDLTLLETLKLNNNNISQASGIRANFSIMQTLDLSFNQISELPNRCFKNFQHLESLDLSYNRISILHEGLFDNLFRLVFLYLNGNKISDLFQIGIPAFPPTLQHLDLSRNQIIDLPDRAFSYLEQLRYLNLSYNRISVLRYGIFKNLTQLIYLDLNNNKISDLTGISANLNKLAYLDLSRNQITELPDRAFSYLQQLSYLNLSYNFISSIPYQFCDALYRYELLVDLRLNNNYISMISCAGMYRRYSLQIEHMDLSSNRISVIPNDFFYYSDLMWLNLQNNTIIDIGTSGICSSYMMNLRYLDLSRNNISYIPLYCLIGMNYLEFLDLSGNRLPGVILNHIGNMKHLKHINISHNALAFVDFSLNSFSIGNLFDIDFLLQQRLMDFSYNQISSVDAWLLVLAKYCYNCTIDLSYNQITNFTNIHRSIFGEHFYDNINPHNIVMDLKGNGIRHITDMIKGWNFKNATRFFGFIQNNYKQQFGISIDSLVCDCGDFAVKQYYNELKGLNLDMTQAICSNKTDLRKTSISSISIDDMVCHIEEDCPSNCSCNEQPSTNSMIINCTDVGLTDMPTTLPSLNHLPGYKYHLDLSKSRINRLIYKDYVSETTHLDISNSSAEEIDPQMCTALQTMSNVSLRNNLLTQFPEVQHGSFTGNQLDIQNNPISCDCKNKWLKSWLESIDKKILNLKGVNCNAPEWLKGKSVIMLQDEDFCSDPPYTLIDVLLITIPTIGGLVLLSVIVVLLLRKFRFKIFKYTKIHLFDRDECEGEDMDYDVFLSRSFRDEEFAEELISLLEREGCTVCYPDKDFEPGSVIYDNIFDSIYKCKRVLCLMTKDFVQSNYCMAEFLIACSRDLEMGKKRTILLLKEPVQQFRDDEQVPNEVRDYIRRHTCIVEKENADWEIQIMYAMPKHRILNMAETRFDGNMELMDCDPLETMLPDGEDRNDRRRLLNF